MFIRVEVMDEESTSVFVPNMENPEELGIPDDVMEMEQQQIDSDVQVDPSVARRIAYLEGPFQKEVYRPLEFRTSEEAHKGTIGKVDGNTLYIELEEEGTVAVEMHQIKEIFWRGKPFAEE